MSQIWINLEFKIISIFMQEKRGLWEKIFKGTRQSFFGNVYILFPLSRKLMKASFAINANKGRF